MEEFKIKEIIKSLYTNYDFLNIYTVLNYYKDKKKLNYEIVNTLLEISLNKKVFPKDDDYQMMKYLFVQIKQNNIGINKKIYDKFLISNWRKDIKMSNLFLNEIEYCSNVTNLASRPLLGEICLTTKCNLKCIMCNFPKLLDFELNELAINSIKTLLKYLVRVSWYGGEVLFFKKFFDLIECAKNNNVQQKIITNGLLWKEEQIERLIENNVEIEVSVDGFDDESYFYTRRVKGFSLVKNFLEIIKKYNKNKIKVSLNIIVIKSNLNMLNKLRDFILQYNIVEVSFLKLRNFNYDFFSKECLDEKDLSIVNSAIKNLRDLNITINSDFQEKHEKEENPREEDKEIYLNSENLKSCYAPWKHIGVYSDGNVGFGCRCINTKFYLGDINKSDIIELWNSRKAQDIRKKIIEAKGTLLKSCLDVGCYGMYY